MTRSLFLLLGAYALTACTAPTGDGGSGSSTDAGPSAVCGNSVLEDGEECDDGNTRNNDGCDRNCMDEATGHCGDGNVDAGEECDDGNTIPGDGCDNRCQEENAADNNDTFDTAQFIEGNSAEGVIGTPGDVDFYRIEANAGDWLVAGTSANQEDDPTKVDTVITVYDAEQNQIAENDDAHPRRNTDSEVITRLVAGGVYYIKVQEWSTWANDGAEGQADYTYSLTAVTIPVDSIGASALYATEGEDVIALDTEEKALILGGLETADDVDVFSFTVASAEAAHFSAQLMPIGTDGYGSTAAGTRMWITDANNSIVARIAHAQGTDEVSPGGLAAGDYQLHVAHGGNAGANDFYVVKFSLGGDNPAEMNEEANGTIAGSEVMESRQQGNATIYFILANLSADDVDYFSFDHAEGNSISVACGSASSGSGLEGLRAEVRNGDDVEIAAMDEGAEGIYIRQTPAPAGTYHLRLSATGQDAEVVGNWVRCGVYSAPPR